MNDDKLTPIQKDLAAAVCSEITNTVPADAEDKLYSSLKTVEIALNTGEVLSSQIEQQVEKSVIEPELVDTVPQLASLKTELTEEAKQRALDLARQQEEEHERKRAEIIKVEEAARQKRAIYEKDKAFFEQNIAQKARGLCEIQEDYIKVLHPLYREKFMEGIRKYGTLAAAMKWMKDNHGLKLRSDVLQRIVSVIPSFKQEMEDAYGEYQAMLHMELQRRAIEGTDKNIYFNGQLIATEKTYSDNLLVKMVDTYNNDYKGAKANDNGNKNIINVQIIKDFHNHKD